MLRFRILWTKSIFLFGVSTYFNTGCNRIRHKNVKIYCDQTNSDIRTQFITERLLTIQVMRHLKPSTRCHHWLVRCSRPTKWRILLTWKRRNMCCSSSKTIQRHRFNGGFIRIMVKKLLHQNPFTSDTNRLIKLAAFVLRRRIRADDQVTKLQSVFLRRLSVVRRNPHGGQAGNWVTSATWLRTVPCQRLSLQPYRLLLLLGLKPNDQARRRYA
jgi:hypothetical protein